MTATKIYVISDLHLGESPQNDLRRRRFCSRSDLLAKFLRKVAEQSLHSIELVVNGDFVDFLLPQEDGQPTFVADPIQALRRIEKIVTQDEPDVFRALKTVAQRQTLRVLLGNHDLELRYSQVQAYLSAQLGLGRLWLQWQPYTPTGAVIVHGNQYDGWNQVDYEALRRYADWCQTPSGAAPAFEPPPGSRLVVEVINKLKPRYPFVDLLKPEVPAVIPLLLALEPEYIARIPGSTKLIDADLCNKARRLLLQAAPAMASIDIHVRMGGISAADQPQPINVSAQQLELAMASAVQAMGETGAADFFGNLYGPLTQTGASQAEISLRTTIRQLPGLWGLFQLRESKQHDYNQRLDLLCQALRPLRQEPVFHTSVETDTTLLRAATNLADHYNARFVVFGHTHLAKRVKLSCPEGQAERLYLNSGTWADLLQIPHGIFDPNWVVARNCMREFVASWWPEKTTDQRPQPSVALAPILHYVALKQGKAGTIDSADLYEFGDSSDEIA